ncbi:hypothetical protein FIBSPDRAFT_955483 [Athelia psychrophila]|uniref:Uncharacterized protein n=1 Tax=Athelia psychrophila TaxID=1759441 RepID=A0A166HYK7_9AGAM|nr:hypothetical protein FIBSPDRAFT_955483 [Fibularhizoctonia sp. CBS 109695]
MTLASTFTVQCDISAEPRSPANKHPLQVVIKEHLDSCYRLVAACATNASLQAEQCEMTTAGAKPEHGYAGCPSAHPNPDVRCCASVRAHIRRYGRASASSGPARPVRATAPVLHPSRPLETHG